MPLSSTPSWPAPWWVKAPAIPDLTITDQKLTEELYGVGCRKGSDLASFINSVMADAYADGVLEATAETYGVQAALVEQPASEFTASESDSDVQYIKDKGHAGHRHHRV